MQLVCLIFHVISLDELDLDYGGNQTIAFGDELLLGKLSDWENRKGFILRLPKFWINLELKDLHRIPLGYSFAESACICWFVFTFLFFSCGFSHLFFFCDQDKFRLVWHYDKMWLRLQKWKVSAVLVGNCHRAVHATLKLACLRVQRACVGVWDTLACKHDVSQWGTSLRVSCFDFLTYKLMFLE